MLRPILTLVLLTTVWMGIVLSHTEIASADSAVCYWQSTTGQTIDLSSICGQVSNSNQTNTSFQSLLKTYSPKIQQDVIQYIQKNRDSVIAQAKTTCRILRYGGQQAAATRRQALTNYQTNNQNSSESSQARQATIYAYAIANYCPEFAK